MLNSYQQLKVWQKSIELVKEELYGITGQSRRAVISIPSNVAEDYTRKHRREYVQFTRVTFASGAELETLLLIAKQLKLAPQKEFQRSEALLNEVMKMLNGLINP